MFVSSWVIDRTTSHEPWLGKTKRVLIMIMCLSSAVNSRAISHDSCTNYCEKVTSEFCWGINEMFVFYMVSGPPV